MNDELERIKRCTITKDEFAALNNYIRFNCVPKDDFDKLFATVGLNQINENEHYETNYKSFYKLEKRLKDSNEKIQNSTGDLEEFKFMNQ